MLAVRSMHLGSGKVGEGEGERGRRDAEGQDGGNEGGRRPEEGKEKYVYIVGSIYTANSFYY